MTNKDDWRGYQPLAVFDYSGFPHARKHGPVGYSDSVSFKPWLRDEFSFRCVYCLKRETFVPPDGQDIFDVEHYLPQRDHPELAKDYDNLHYSCRQCNLAKGTGPLPLDPCRDDLSQHLVMNHSGSLIHKSEKGRVFIEILRLNSQRNQKFRREVLQQIRVLQELSCREAQEMFRSRLGYPDNLPDLKSLRPKENSRPHGAPSCFFERRLTGTLPEFY